MKQRRSDNARGPRAKPTRYFMTWVMAAAAGLMFLSACGGGEGEDGGQAGRGGAPPDAIVFDDEQEPPDRADVSYVGNLLSKVDAGEWTLGEGLVATLQLFAAERDAQSVLRQRELLTHEGTGIFTMAREYQQDGPDVDDRGEIDRLLDLLVFSVDELEEMAGSVPKAGLIRTKASIENCLQFFSGFADYPAGVGVCLQEESTTIGGDLYRVFSPAGSLPSGGWTDAHVQLALQAMKDAVPKYKELGKMPAVALVLAAADGGDLWGASFPHPGTTCGIAINTSLQSKAPDEFKQLVAHELAHCFQAETHPGQHQAPYLVIDWHFEGAAEYWSNVVYPPVNLEWRFLEKLEQIELVTTVIGREYENFMFFQYLGSKMGNDGILDLIGKLPTGFNTAVEQRDALASYPNMAQTYHDFVKAMTDGAVQDTSGALIPFTAQAYYAFILGNSQPLVTAPIVIPFATYRVLLGIDPRRQAQLAFRGSGPLIESSGPASEGVSTQASGLVVESLKSTGGRAWSPRVPSELPEKECDTHRTMLVVTATELNASFDLDVPEINELDACCLHGTWLMNNQDLADADAAALNLEVSYGGQLTAEYHPDGTVLFLWGGFSRAFTEHVPGEGPRTSTDVVGGGGSQFYSTHTGNILLYTGPEITPTVTSEGGTFTARLDTGLGDLQTSQFFECEGDTLLTIIRGGVEIGWSRLN